MRFLLSASLCFAFVTLPAYGDGPAPTSQPASVSAEDVDSEMESFLKSDLPKDIPLPEKTPFEKDPVERARYLEAYRNGFAGAATGMIVTRCGIFSPATKQGYDDGDRAGEKLHSLRAEAEDKRRFAWIHKDSIPITDKSLEADRKVRDDFAVLSKRYLDELQLSYPRTVTITKSATPRSVYSYKYEDYSGSNTGRSVLRIRYGAVLEFEVTTSEPKVNRAEDNELQGSYFMEFEYLDGHWTIAEWNEMTHMQVTGRSANGETTYSESRNSVLAKRLLKHSFEKASKSPQG